MPGQRTRPSSGHADGRDDAGVANQVLENRATISDLINQTAASAGNQSECVNAIAQLTNDWKRDGYISGRRKGVVQSAAARA